MNFSIRHHKLTVPIALIRYCYLHKLIKPLVVFICLKFYSDGKMGETSIFELLRDVMLIKDRRTIKKYLAKLRKLNWIGYNPVSGNYFIRSFDKIKFEAPIKGRQAACCNIKNLAVLEEFFIGAVISKEINVQKYLRVIKAGKYRAAVNNKDIAIQPKNSLPKHFGLSSLLIAKITNCKQTRACQLKHDTAKAGFIKVKHRYGDVVDRYGNIIKFEQPDLNLKPYLAETDKNSKKLKMKKQKDGSLKLVEQLYDEIIPLVAIKKRGSFKQGKILANVPLAS